MSGKDGQLFVSYEMSTCCKNVYATERGMCHKEEGLMPEIEPSISGTYPPLGFVIREEAQKFFGAPH